MSIFKVGKHPNGSPIYEIGFVSWNGPAIAVTAMLSWENSMEKVGGWHIVLATNPSLTWSAARGRSIYASSLLAVFEQNAFGVLAALFGEIFSKDQIDTLAHAIGGDTERTTKRTDIHAHVQVAYAETWKSGNVRRMVDDARAPGLIAAEAVKAAQRIAGGPAVVWGGIPSTGVVVELVVPQGRRFDPTHPELTERN